MISQTKAFTFFAIVAVVFSTSTNGATLRGQSRSLTDCSAVWRCEIDCDSGCVPNDCPHLGYFQNECGTANKACQSVEYCDSTTSAPTTSAPTSSPTTTPPTSAPTTNTETQDLSLTDKITTPITNYVRFYEPTWGSIIDVDNDNGWMIVTASNREAVTISTQDSPSSATILYNENAIADYTQFGSSVAVHGDYAMIGAPFETFVDASEESNSGAGAVYVYQYVNSAWTYIGLLDTPDLIPNQSFGWSVAMSGDWAVAGSYGRSGTYFYQLKSGSFTLQTTVSSTISAVGMDGSVAALMNDGAVSIYELSGSTWSVSKTFSCDSCVTNERMQAVAVSGETVVVGTYASKGWTASDGDSYTGQVIVYKKVNNVWTQVQILRPSDGSDSDFFGTAVDIKGTTILVGAESNDDVVTNGGKAYQFDYDSSAGAWFEKYIITASDAGSGDKFGTAVALGATKNFVSSPQDDDVLTNGGAIYEYDA